MYCLDRRIFRGREVPCGRCKTCLARSASLKRWVYRTRISAEIGAAERTWFVTLTLRKEMSDHVGYKLVQRWLKRLRKASFEVRYACVAEHGGLRGRLHYHVVLHGPMSLTERAIRKRWRGGISQATLVGSTDAPRVALYSSKVANYAVKGGRFRFSQGYGSRPIKRLMSNDIVARVMDLYPGCRVRYRGSVVPRSLLPAQPGFRSWWSADLHREADEVRAELHAEPRGRGGKLIPPWIIETDPSTIDREITLDD